MASPFLRLDPGAYGLSESLSADVRRLDELLGTVLLEQEGPELVRLARALLAEGDDPRPLTERHPELADPALARRVARAFTVVFQLVNTAEQKEIVRVNREREGRGPRREVHLGGRRALKEKGDPAAEEARALVARIEIAPTLTAHPTEAKRKAVLDKLQGIALLLAEAEAKPSLTQRLEPEDRSGEIERTLTGLWQTDEDARGHLTVPEAMRNNALLSAHDHGGRAIGCTGTSRRPWRRRIRERCSKCPLLTYPLLGRRRSGRSERDARSDRTPSAARDSPSVPTSGESPRFGRADAERDSSRWTRPAGVRRSGGRRAGSFPGADSALLTSPMCSSSSSSRPVSRTPWAKFAICAVPNPGSPM